MLRNGSSGDEVMALQKSLAAMSIDPGPADGIFGPQTAAAVKQFQEESGLAADGIAGPKTMAALAEATGGACSAGFAEGAGEGAPGVEALRRGPRSGRGWRRRRCTDRCGAACEGTKAAADALKDTFAAKSGGGESDGPQ